MFMLHAPFCRSSNRTWHTETNYLMFIQKALHENFTSIKQTIMERPGIACALGKIWLQVRWQNVPTTKCPSAQCVLCNVYFSAQPNKLRPILKFEFGIPLNICLSQLVRVCAKYICSHFCDFETLDTWFPLKYVPVSSPSSLNMPHHHHHHH